MSYKALEGNVLGSNNTAVGYKTLQNSNSDRNTALGTGAGNTTDAGSQNIYHWFRCR